MEIDLLSVILLLLIALFTFLSIHDAPNPDVHPLLLASQSNVARVRYPGEAAVYSSSQHSSDTDKNVRTLADVFQRGLQQGTNCIGFRFDGSYTWQTYNQVSERLSNFGSGLIKLTGLSPRNNDLFGIFMKNRPEWLIADFAASHYSLVSVALPSLHPRLQDTIDEINHTQITTIVTSADFLPIALSAAPSCKTLKYIVLAEDMISAEKSKQAGELGLIVKTFNEVEQLGAQNKLDYILPEHKNTATIIFSSGTSSGKPRGVELTHENILAGVAGIIAAPPTPQKIAPSDVYLSYLALAQIYERIAVIALIYSGASIAFYSGDVSRLLQDAQDVKPTIFASVPRFLTRFQETIIQTHGNKFLYNRAFKSKLYWLKKGRLLKNSIWDLLVFNEINVKLGGRVRIIIAATAPISQETLDFLRVTLGCQVIQAYGLTETSGPVTASLFCDYQASNQEGLEAYVGPPLFNEIKLVNLEESGYTAEDLPNPRGEICVRGPNVMKGYYNMPQETAKDSDGWFHTGDIGMMLPNGTLKILGRKVY